MPPPDVLPQMPTPDQFTAANKQQKLKLMQSLEWHYLRNAYQEDLQPIFGPLEQVPMFLTLQQLVVQARETWIVGPTMLRDCLITISKHWQEAYGTECPYTFTTEDIEKHALEEYHMFRIAVLSISTQEYVKGDGFVEGDVDVMRKFFADLRKEVVPKVEGEGYEDRLGISRAL